MIKGLTADSLLHQLDGMDATHYPARNVSDTGWKHRSVMDTTLDATAGEGTGTDLADLPATAS